jgi:riboflavin-specific deaminase-like protein
VSPQRKATDPAAEGAPARLRALLGDGGALTAQELADRLVLSRESDPPPQRPYLLLNMIATADGRATIGGRSGPLGNRADRELFHALRAVVDAVMVGAGTVRAERYGPLVRRPEQRRARVERGLREQPLACIVSGRLALAPDIPLLAGPESHVAIITPASASLPKAAARVDYVRAERDGELDLRAAMAELRARFDVRTLLCEGGPHLNAHLLEAGLVDELLLALSPKLAGGDPTTGEALRIVAGPALAEPVALRLIGVAENESFLFLRYGVCASASERAS